MARQSAAQDSRVVDDSSVERRQLVEVGGAAEPTRREERVVLGDLLYVLEQRTNPTPTAAVPAMKPKATAIRDPIRKMAAGK